MTAPWWWRGLQADPEYERLRSFPHYVQARAEASSDPGLMLSQVGDDWHREMKALWAKHGHDKAWAASSRAHKPIWRKIRAVARAKPATVEGLAAKASLLAYCIPDCNLDAQSADHQWHEVLARDARRLARSAMA